MRILILANNDVGLYKFRRELLERLLQNHEIYIALPMGEYIESLQKLGCQYIPLEVDRRGTNLAHDFKLIKKYLSLIKSVKPDVVLTYTIKPSIYGGLASRIQKKKYIVNITGMGTAVENDGFLQKMILRMYRVSLKKVTCVFFQNKENQSFFEKNRLFSSRCHLIPGSGVNLAEHCLEAYPEMESREIKFLFIGRIMKDKGIEELLDAAEKIGELYSNVSFDILGDYEEDYSAPIRALERKGIVKYWGMQYDVHPFIKDCNAVILPSYHEGMANVLLEAASTGRPVLASKIPGCLETFEEGVSGLGFNPRDAEDLYQTIKKFLQLSWEEKAAMGLAGRKKMEREFDRNIVIDAYLEELEALEG